MLIQPSLLKKLINKEDNSRLFAESETISGEFFLEGLDIQLAITDEEMDNILEAQNILFEQRKGIQSYSKKEIQQAESLYIPFMQVHNHELVHLMQVLSLPALKVRWATKATYLRLEATIMLRYFELGY